VIGLVRIGRWHDASELARLKSRSSGEVELATRPPANLRSANCSNRTKGNRNEVGGDLASATRAISKGDNERSNTPEPSRVEKGCMGGTLSSTGIQKRSNEASTAGSIGRKKRVVLASSSKAEQPSVLYGDVKPQKYGKRSNPYASSSLCATGKSSKASGAPSQYTSEKLHDKTRAHKTVSRRGASASSKSLVNKKKLSSTSKTLVNKKALSTKKRNTPSTVTFTFPGNKLKRKKQDITCVIKNTKASLGKDFDFSF